MPNDKIRSYINNSSNPRKDRGKNQRIYLLKIHPTVCKTIEEKDELDIEESESLSDVSDLFDSDDSDLDTDLDSDLDETPEPESMKEEVKPNNLERKFDLCGTTNNIYTVVINTNPTCTCPDYSLRKNRCKHIFFILVRVMKVNKENEDKLKYTDEELVKMFDNMPKHMTDVTSDVVDNNLLKTYEKVSTNIHTNTQANKKGKAKGVTKEIKSKISEDTRCPVCLEALYESKESIENCKHGCGCTVHTDCINTYNNYRKKTGYDSVCLVCQKKWISTTTVKENNEYIKL
jgi:hypothetical protein